MPVTARLAERRDAEAIREIYNREVSGSTVTFDLVRVVDGDDRRVTAGMLVDPGELLGQ